MAESFGYVAPAQRQREAQRVLQLLSKGIQESASDLESAIVDIKEEAGRRASDGSVRAGQGHNEAAAKQLAKAAACMANSPGGGVLIVGVDDKSGRIIGAETDPQWLRSRVYDLTERKLTVDIRQAEINKRVVLVIDVPQAIEPVPYGGQYQHRVDSRCVPATQTELLGGLFSRLAADVSYQPSATLIEQVSPSAEVALRRQIARHDKAKSRLTLRDLLGRLGLIAGDGKNLNIAGEILLSDRDRPAIEYTFRHVPGGPSVVRIAEGGRSLIEEITDVVAEANRHNQLRDVPVGLQVHSVRAIPERSTREAILNACCHRDWSREGPTIVKHVGSHLYVTSPGGLIGGVREDNIIRHPAVPRYRTLMDAVRQTGLVEREGVGVDRLFADMISIGSPLPIIEELPDPAVRVTLLGGPVNERCFRLFATLSPTGAGDDVDAALVVWRGSRPKSLFLTGKSCAPLMQRSVDDAEASLQRVAAYTFGSQGEHQLIEPMRSIPKFTPPAWILSKAARAALGLPLKMASPECALKWAADRGRISSTEFSEITGVSTPTAGTHLKALAEDGHLEPSSKTGRGRGFHYRPISMN